MKQAKSKNIKNKMIRVRLKPLPAAEQREYEKAAAEYAKMSTEELLRMAKPLTPSQRERWTRVKAGRPRKSPELKAARVLFTIDPKLLKQADAYALSHGMTRAQLIASGIRKLMSA